MISLLATLLMVPLAAPAPVPLIAHLAATLCAAPLAPMLALFYAAAAQNKVQGFAVMKASGIISVPPMIAYFIEGAWQWLVGLAPTYWPVKVYWLLEAGDALGWLALAVGLAYQGLLIALLLRWYQRVMHTGN